MKILILLAMLPAVLMISPLTAHGAANLENVDILAESNLFNNMFLALEFGDYDYNRRGKAIPVVESAFLDIGGDIISLDNLRVKIYGNSFAVHSEDILIYALGLGNEQYKLNLYILDGTGFNKITLFTTDDIPEEDVLDIRGQPIPPEMTVLVQQDQRNYWRDNYDIAVRVYDNALNANPQWDQSFGAIEGVNISVTITNEETDEVLTTFTGKTDSKGIWESDYIIVENLTDGGKYLVDVTTQYLGSEKSQTLEMFVISEVPEDSGA